LQFNDEGFVAAIDSHRDPFAPLGLALRPCVLRLFLERRLAGIPMRKQSSTIAKKIYAGR